LRSARIGLLANLLGSEPADTEVAMIVRGAVNEMKGQGAEVVEITIPSVNEHMNDGTVQNVDFKFDLNAYLASRPSAPVRSLEEILASGKYHKSVENNLRTSQAFESRDTKDYLQHLAMRGILRDAILKAMADNNLDALAYPTIRRRRTLSARRSWGLTAG
jgi:amidase